MKDFDKQVIENISKQYNPDLSPTKYKVYLNTYINANISFFKLFTNGIGNSEIKPYPIFNLKLWSIFFLQLLGFQKNKNKIKAETIFGLIAFWFFLKTKEINTEADLIFIKPNFIILVHNKKNKYVLKISRTEIGNHRLKNEVKSLNIAGNINYQNVSIPKLIDDKSYSAQPFIKENFIKGKNLTEVNSKEYNAIYDRVFGFITEFYFNSGIKLCDANAVHFTNDDAINKIISSKKFGKDIISTFINLKKSNKKLFWSRIHGDLGYNNILLDENSNISIIDWEKSKETFIMMDLKISLYDTQQIFEKILQRFKTNNNHTDEIYSYNEQMFLVLYLDLCQFIENAINRNRLHLKNHHIIESRIKKLHNISQNF